MKKKLFTLMTLLLCLCSGAWADETVTFTGSDLNITSSSQTIAPITFAIHAENTKAISYASNKLSVANGGILSFKASDATISKVEFTINSTNDRFDGTKCVPSCTVTKSSSVHTLTLSSASNELKVVTKSSGIEISQIVVTYTTKSVKAPQITPNSGDLLTTQSFTLNTETEGASIYYTTDGSTPTSASSLYEEPFTIATLNTLLKIKAIAIKNTDESLVTTSGDIYISSSPAKSTWDLTSITTDDLSATWWNDGKTANRNGFGSNTDVTILNNHGFDLCKGISVGRTNNTISAGKIDIIIGRGIRNNTSSGYFKIPVTSGKKYKITYGTNSTSNPVGFSITSGADYESGNLTSTINNTSNFDYFIARATASTIMLTISGTNTYLSKVEEVSSDPVDPTFNISETSIEVGETAQIVVGDKANLDGIELSDITITDADTDEAADYVSVDENGVVTAEKAGNAKISFTSSAVAEKWNASSGNVTITVTKAKTDVALSFGETTTFNVDSDEDFDEPTLTVSPNVAAITSNITYSISNSGSNATINSSTGVVSLGSKTGTATVTATFDGDDDYKEANASYTINITEAPLRTVKISDETITFVDSYSAPITSVGGVGYDPNEDGETYDIKFKGAFNFALSSDTKRFKKIVFHLNPNSMSGGKHKYLDSSSSFTASVGNLTFPDAPITTITWDDNGTKLVSAVNFNYSDNNHSLFVNSIDVTYWDTEGTKTESVVTNFGWATYITPDNVQFAEGDAFVVTDINTSTGATTVESVTQVPANTPVLLKGAGEKTITILNSVPAAPSTNLMEVYDGSDKGTKVPYVLAKNGESAGFKKWAGAASVITGRAVMWLDSAIATAREFFSLDDVTTGINALDNELLTIDNNAPMYNLAGQKVGKNYKGIVIVNGKKVVRK